MLSRIQMFAEPLMVMAIVSVLYILFLRVVVERLLKTKIERVSWVAKNIKKVGVPLHLLMILVGAPFLEELIFRAPLVILFGQLTPGAWAAIALSSIGFAAIHLKNPSTQPIHELLERYKQGELESDHLPTELSRIKNGKSDAETLKVEKIGRVVQVVFAFLIGVVAGYLGIRHQSLWLPIIVHFSANLVGPILLGLIFVVAFAFFRLILPVWDRIDSVKRKLRRRKSPYYHHW